MTKRRLDDDDLVNLLRQKHKEDPQQKQQAARYTFAMLMRAQQSPMPPSTPNPGPSYQYFNNNNPAQPSAVACYKCSTAAAHGTCHHCEHHLCQSCFQQCNLCQHVYCSTCSNIDYSQSTEQVFCLSCTRG
ncbi:hypothetical protein V8B55DRAFT_1536684 [Mucor lusitanicus]|uniref:Uncharacterized protein n=1 Tax=Mucor circinelloides f. lusitanicus TaxID=29924 RepID=A0A8H4BE41_MUCCL|nr:hypothetical protein FB192DRAFT_1380427 [Mucor lusitanicus]